MLQQNIHWIDLNFSEKILVGKRPIKFKLFGNYFLMYIKIYKQKPKFNSSKLQ